MNEWLSWNVSNACGRVRTERIETEVTLKPTMIYCTWEKWCNIDGWAGNITKATGRIVVGYKTGGVKWGWSNVSRMLGD